MDSMSDKKRTFKRIEFITEMREKGITVHTRMSFMIHVANLDSKEDGDIIVKESKELLESGATEQEFVRFLQEKYGLRHVLDMTEDELDEIHKKISAKSKTLKTIL